MHIKTIAQQNGKRPSALDIDRRDDARCAQVMLLLQKIEVEDARKFVDTTRMHSYTMPYFDYIALVVASIDFRPVLHQRNSC
jgi:hypothetical protein